MKGKPQDCMAVGMIHFMAFPQAMKPGGPMVETIEQLCADDYFQVIEVTRIADAGARQRAIEAVKKAGKTVAFGAQPVLLGGRHDLNAVDPVARQKAVDAVRACIPEAKEWGAVGLAVLSGPQCAAADRALARTMLCVSMKELCECSRRAGGPPIFLEIFDAVAFGKNCLVGATREAVQVADKVFPFYREFGLMHDLSHLPLLGESPEQALKASAEYLRHVHIGNCVMRDAKHPAYGDNHPLFGIPEGENGVPQLAAFLKVLFEIGYIGEGKRNIVSFEIKPFGSQTSDEVIANAKATLNAAWSLL